MGKYNIKLSVKSRKQNVIPPYPGTVHATPELLELHKSKAYY
jgi:hypothetical protein